MASKIMGYRPILLPASCDAGKKVTKKKVGLGRVFEKKL
jgi:hypothetical protein